MAAVTNCSDFGAPKNKVWHCFHCFPIYFPWSDGTDAMIFIFWMLSFKPTFSLCSFTYIKRVFSSSLSAIRVVSSAYVRLLIFFPGILIPACASSSPGFLMMYFAYKLNKQGGSIQPWHTPFPIWKQSVVPRPALTVVSWPPYRFLKRQVRLSGIPRLTQCSFQGWENQQNMVTVISSGKAYVDRILACHFSKFRPKSGFVKVLG